VPYFAIEAAVDAGATAEPLVRAAGIAPGVAPTADVHIPAERSIALWDLVIDAVGNPDLGLGVAAKLRIEDNEVSGFRATSCATLGEAFERTVRYRALCYAGARRELQRDADAERLIYYPSPSSGRPARSLASSRRNDNDYPRGAISSSSTRRTSISSVPPRISA